MSIARALSCAGLLCAVPLLAAAQAPIKVACVGDSITASSSRYPTWLGQLLGSAWQVKNFGVSGTTMMKRSSTPYWNTTKFTDSSNYLPNVVIIMLGTNDSKTFNWSAHGAEYKPNYLDMVHHYQSLSSHPTVYVMTSPPNFNFSGSYQPLVIRDQIVPIVHQVSAETGAPLIDIFGPLTGHSELFSDGTHPTTAGSQKIAALVETALRKEQKLPVDAAHVSASSDDGNVPANAVDGALTTRWSASGDGQWIRFDLGAIRSVSHVKIAFHNGNVRRARFDVQTSVDGTSWTNRLTGAESAGTTTAAETFDFADIDARYVRYLGHGNSSNLWNSLTEVGVYTRAAR
jgi:lysophospholipase L1-like esterase